MSTLNEAVKAVFMQMVGLVSAGADWLSHYIYAAWFLLVLLLIVAVIISLTEE